MKVIFLDFDGVICLRDNWGSRWKKYDKWRKSVGNNGAKEPIDCEFDNFDIKSIKLLNSIIKETDCEIVVSSDWRHHGSLESIGDYFISQGIIKRPIDVTDTIRLKSWPEKGYIPENYPWEDSKNLQQWRSLEILKWLSEHPEISNWVAVDDLDMSYRNGWGLTNFVLTPKSREGIKQSGVKEKILKFLK